MMSAKKLCPDNFWDVKEALVVQNLINIFPPLLAKLLIGSEFANVFVFILQLLQLHTHIVNAGYIKFFS